MLSRGGFCLTKYTRLIWLSKQEKQNKKAGLRTGCNKLKISHQKIQAKLSDKMIGLDWIGLDWIGLDWIGLAWFGLAIF